MRGQGEAGRAKEYVSLGSRVCLWMWGQDYAVEMVLSFGACHLLVPFSPKASTSPMLGVCRDPNP